MIYNTDMFAMFNVSADRKAAQLALADATMSPSFQSAFNVVKGSVPARMDVPDTAFDMCGKKGIADVKAANDEGHVRRLDGAELRAAAGDRRGVYHDVVTKFFHGEIKTSDAAVTELVKAHQRRQVTREPPPRLGGGGPLASEEPRHDRLDRRAHRHAASGARSSLRERLQDWLPRLVLAPSFALVLFFVYGFNLWTFVSVVHQLEGVHQPRLRRLEQLSESSGTGRSRPTRRRTGTPPSSTWAYSAASMSSSA